MFLLNHVALSYYGRSPLVPRVLESIRVVVSVLARVVVVELDPNVVKQPGGKHAV